MAKATLEGVKAKATRAKVSSTNSNSKVFPKYYRQRQQAKIELFFYKPVVVAEPDLRTEPQPIETPKAQPKPVDLCDSIEQSILASLKRKWGNSLDRAFGGK
jgi:hypothetical protein